MKNSTSSPFTLLWQYFVYWHIFSHLTNDLVDAIFPVVAQLPCSPSGCHIPHKNTVTLMQHRTVMSLSVTAYPFPWGRGVLLLEPIPALSQGEGRVLPGQAYPFPWGSTELLTLMSWFLLLLSAHFLVFALVNLYASCICCFQFLMYSL